MKASVYFTHNYTQNGLFDVKFNISKIQFVELSEPKVNESIRDKALKTFKYDYEPTNIEDNKLHRGFIILSKKNFNMSFYNLNKAEDDLNNNNTHNFNLKDVDDKICEGFNYKVNDTVKKNDNENFNYNLIKDIKKIIDPNLSIVQEKGIESCFIFTNPNSAVEALNILFETNQLIHDNWNIIIFIIFILFFFFMKINIFFELIKSLNKFKFDNFPNIFQLKNFYVYVIFNGTLLFVIPLLFFGYDDYNFDFCLGFSEAYFNSFLADRQIFLERQKEYFDPYQSEFNRNYDDENLKFRNNLFFVHDANRNTNNFITRLGYLKNMLFLCVFVWLSGMRKIFNAKKIKIRKNISEVDYDMNNSEMETRENFEQGNFLSLYLFNKKIIY